MLAIILAGVLLGGTAILVAGKRPEPRRIRVEAEDRRPIRRR